MTDEQKTAVKRYAIAINSTVVDGSLLDYVIDEVADRVLLYLNRIDIPEKMVRVIASVVVGVFQNYNSNKDSAASKLAITGVSDNGQSVSYANNLRTFMASSTDNELFGGFSAQLSRYRSIGVVGQ